MSTDLQDEVKRLKANYNLAMERAHKAEAKVAGLEAQIEGLRKFADGSVRNELSALRATVERVRALCDAVEAAGLSQLLSTGELRAALAGDAE